MTSQLQRRHNRLKWGRFLKRLGTTAVEDARILREI